MKKSELKQLIKEEVKRLQNISESQQEMSDLLEKGKKHLEIIKQSMRKKGYEI